MMNVYMLMLPVPVKKTDETFEACNSLMVFEPASKTLVDSLGL
jgi:hypothetical protein